MQVGLNVSSGAQFAPLSLVKPVVGFLRLPLSTDVPVLLLNQPIVLLGEHNFYVGAHPLGMALFNQFVHVCSCCGSSVMLSLV